MLDWKGGSCTQKLLEKGANKNGRWGSGFGLRGVSVNKWEQRKYCWFTGCHVSKMPGFPQHLSWPHFSIPSCLAAVEKYLSLISKPLLPTWPF